MTVFADRGFGHAQCRLVVREEALGEYFENFEIGNCFSKRLI